MVDVSEKWKIRYLQAAAMVASWSKIEDDQRSAIIAGEDNRFMSLGFNGFAREVRDVIDRIDDPEVRKALLIKASENSIYFSQSKDFSKAVIYTHPELPELDELARIAQYQIKHIISAGGKEKLNDPIYRAALRESDITYEIVENVPKLEIKPIEWAVNPDSIDKWDKRYLELSQLVSSWSKDPSTKVGAVIVRENKSIASIGFNGLPAGVDDAPERLADRSIKYPLTIHAEENAMRFAGGEDFSKSRVYVYPCQPCGPCLSKLSQNGLKDVMTVREVGSDMEKRWATSFAISRDIIAKESKVKIESIDIYPREPELEKAHETCGCNHKHEGEMIR